MDRWEQSRTSGLARLMPVLALAVLLGPLVHCSQAPEDPLPLTRANLSSPAMSSGPDEQARSSPPRAVSASVLLANETFIRVSKQAKASVVNISSTRRSQSTPLFDAPFFRRFFGEEFEPQFRVPKKRREQGLGSGVIVTSDGYIVTNHHVVEQAERLTVLLNDKRQFTAELIGTDPQTDLAVIKIPATDLPTLSWGDSASLQVGELVLAVGNPFGLNQTVTMGIVSAVGRANVGIVDYENFIQTDAAINPGNSGGALVNLHGELIGINTAIFSRTGGYMGIGFAIPSQMVQQVMHGLIGQGQVIRGWLGVSIQELTPELAEQFAAPDTTGVLVGGVFDRSPAARGGIQRGDIIRTYNGIQINDPHHLRTLVAETAPETSVTIIVWRNGTERALPVTIAQLPRDVASLTQKEAGEPPNHPLAGLTVAPTSHESGDGQEGVVLTDVEPGSPADRAGLRPGDRLLEINRKPLATISDYRRLTQQLDPQQSVLVLLRRGTGTIFLSIKPE
ncbi:MAG: DegQ family serine endoprotease [Nitrospirae bacterium]|nr:MAG: DegQ family serine endoprotease [Nitrospirota bacterium]